MGWDRRKLPYLENKIARVWGPEQKIFFKIEKMDDEHQRFSDAEEVAVFADQTQPKEESKVVKKKVEGPKKRYIVFVGNLPYDVTKNDLEDLFKNLGIIIILSNLFV